MKLAEARLWLLLDGMKRVSEEHGARFLIANLPINFQVHEDLTSLVLPPTFYGEQHARRDFFHEMEPTLEAHGIPYVDVLDAMKKAATSGKRFYPADGEVHMNPLGYAFTARTLEPVVRRLLAAPPPRPAKHNGTKDTGLPGIEGHD